MPGTEIIMAGGLEVQQYIKGYKGISLMIIYFKESTENLALIETEYKVHRDMQEKLLNPMK